MGIKNYIEQKHRLKDVDYMQVALEVAAQAKSNGDLPIAAVLVWAGGMQIVEHDTRYSDRNPLNHAVINVINKTTSTLNRRLSDATLYCTLEPDLLCALAIKAAGIKEVVFGSYDYKDGFISSKVFDHNLLEITAMGGVLGLECCNMLPDSMQDRLRYE